jgi:hypothetical protein
MARRTTRATVARPFVIKPAEVPMDAETLELVRELRELEDRIERRSAPSHPSWRERADGKPHFGAEIRARHRQLRTRLHHYVLGARALILLTAPVIYAAGVSLLLLDLAVTTYQAVCFPVYGIRKVARGDYFVFDRGQLAYLNLFERFNCAYCSYANGLIAYVREIASRTEQYWCPIKHAKRMKDAHARYPHFVDYGDADAYRRDLAALRRQLG